MADQGMGFIFTLSISNESLMWRSGAYIHVLGLGGASGAARASKFSAMKVQPMSGERPRRSLKTEATDPPRSTARRAGLHHHGLRCLALGRQHRRAAFLESPAIRAEDFYAGVDFLSNHPLVDPDRIGVLGICGGGGYSVNAAQMDHRIQAIAAVSMFDLGRVRREGLDGEITSALRRWCDAQSIGVVGSLHGVPNAPR
jgi:hypothetical protein